MTLYMVYFQCSGLFPLCRFDVEKNTRDRPPIEHARNQRSESLTVPSPPSLPPFLPPSIPPSHMHPHYHEPGELIFTTLVETYKKLILGRSGGVGPDLKKHLYKLSIAQKSGGSKAGGLPPWKI